MMDLNKLSKECSYILRHALENYHLKSDSHGWVCIDSFIDVLRMKFGWSDITTTDIHNMILKSPKKRHEVSAGRIRALYGHSIDKHIQYDSQKPPKYLYHGSPSKNKISILKEGLSKQSRQYVHLSENIEIAYQVALRYDVEVTIFCIASSLAWKDGIEFYNPDSNIWLAHEVPVQYLDIAPYSVVL